MSSTEVVLDARGELCPVPSLKVEQFVKANPARASFSVLVDHRASVESLEVIASRYGFRMEVQEAQGEFRVRFVPNDPAS
jgi:TusA-related sulfurtransferase